MQVLHYAFDVYNRQILEYTYILKFVIWIIKKILSSLHTSNEEIIKVYQRRLAYNIFI